MMKKSLPTEVKNIAFVRNNTTSYLAFLATLSTLDELYMRVLNTSVNNYKLQINTESFITNVEAKTIDLFARTSDAN
jgi:hypothetical protein